MPFTLGNLQGGLPGFINLLLVGLQRNQGFHGIEMAYISCCEQRSTP